MVKRTEFTENDDNLLAQYIARYNPEQQGRLGNVLYQRLVENPDKKWSWSKRHPWTSWRERYKTRQRQLDKLINRFIQRSGQRVAAPTPSQDSRKRVPFTTEDDRNLVEYLASCSPPEGSWLGQKLYSSLVENTDEYPWANRHTWHSWRERYKNNQDWYKWAIKRDLLDGDYDEEAPPAPKTADEWRVHRKSTEASKASNAGKRKRVSDASPSRVPGKSVDDTLDAPKKPAKSQGDNHPDVKDVEEGGEETSDSSEEDEDRDPPGSNDYHGEIFRSPGKTVDSAPTDKRRSTSASSESPAQVLQQLTDDPFAELQDEMDIDDVADQLLTTGEGDNDGERDVDDLISAENDQPVLSKTPPSGASPPPRRHNARIERDIDADPGTPALSPTEAADARHRGRNAHSPAPARKHPKRLRKSNEDDFFATPARATSRSSSAGGSSPTAHHIAHARDHNGEDGGGSRKKEPPRLVEGAWNTAFTDARGNAPIGALGKGPRKSGVDFEEDAEFIGMQEVLESGDEDEDEDGREEEVEATPMQWPPMRNKQTASLATPTRTPSGRDKGKARESGSGSGRMVTTEIVSVKTVRTVRRASKGTPYARATIHAVDDVDASPPASQVQPIEDSQPEASQHHPFSQPSLPPRMAASASNDSTNTGSGTFPRMNDHPRISKADLARLGKMLHTEQDVQKMKSSEPSPSKFERDAQRTAKQPLSGADKRLLSGLLKSDDGSNNAARPAASASLFSMSRATISPPGNPRCADEERFAQFHEREQALLTVPAAPRAQSSPLADKGDSLGGAGGQIIGEIPTKAVFSRLAQTSHPATSVDKGKHRAEQSSAYGHARRHTMSGPEAQDVFSSNRPASVPRQDTHTRQSLPAALSIGDDTLFRPPVLSQLFRQRRSGSAHSRSYSLSRPPGSGSSGSMSPARSVDASLADTLPSNELELVKELGMRWALQVMARNHGFSEETVRQVYEQTRSLEAADHLLRAMRDSANDAANEVLESFSRDADEPQEDSDDVRPDGGGHEGDDDVDAGGVAVERDGSAGKFDEPELEEADDSWMPQAESSRIDAAHGPRKRQQFRIIPVHVEARPAVDEVYSPPKRTRAAKYLRQSIGRAGVQDVAGGDGGMLTGSPTPTGQASGHVSLGQLARYTKEDWRRLGADGAKIATARALEKLLGPRNVAAPSTSVFL
ncbi:hypothetical protein C8Q80DRAFT_1276073 [Daedaleopsis nitida]|nr:hypothetical protein C8Q80DRAFT_1276073 [Daedaleopsis nitida]